MSLMNLYFNRANPPPIKSDPPKADAFNEKRYFVETAIQKYEEGHPLSARRVRKFFADWVKTAEHMRSQELMDELF